MTDPLRRATTESLFRDVNERIAETAHRFDAEAAEFVCECGNASCTDRIPASLDDYETVRGDGARFMLVPGHEDVQVEKVVSRRPRFSIVAKVKNRLVADTVRRLDPRAQAA